jgi:ribosomal protein S14
MQENAILQADFNGKLTPTQERAIVSLLSHATMRTAAKAVGIDDATLWRWLQDKHFHKRYMELRRECPKCGRDRGISRIIVMIPDNHRDVA